MTDVVPCQLLSSESSRASIYCRGRFHAGGVPIESDQLVRFGDLTLLADEFNVDGIDSDEIEGAAARPFGHVELTLHGRDDLRPLIDRCRASDVEGWTGTWSSPTATG